MKVVDKAQPSFDGTVNSETDIKEAASFGEQRITIQGVPYKSLADYEQHCRRAEGYGDPEPSGK